jgi:hypothetical protein
MLGLSVGDIILPNQLAPAARTKQNTFSSTVGDGRVMAGLCLALWIWRVNSQLSPFLQVLFSDVILAANPAGAACYGLSAAAMTSWIADFVNTYHVATGR